MVTRFTSTPVTGGTYHGALCPCRPEGETEPISAIRFRVRGCGAAVGAEQGTTAAGGGQAAGGLSD